jgi:two-component system phosphate regulon sensor histidine kinase PhoR
MSTFQKKFSIILAAIIASLASALYLILSVSGDRNFSWNDLLIFLSATFLLTYTLLLFSNNNFIFERLSQILDSVVNFRNNKESRKNHPISEDVIADIRNEVQGWADDKKNEADRLKKLELYRKEYIGNVSHELKTPIFNIQGYILTLLDGGLEDPKVNREYLVRAEKSVERMINIIEDLESISQLETGELILEPERFDIVALAKDVCEGQEMKATSKGIIFAIKKEEPVFVFADRFRIRQVITNLIVNSIKYGKEYGETIVRFTEVSDQIKIDIADNGIGISQEHLPRLFERFYRIDKSRSREQGGTGLGLSIVKHILEAHGQNITVTSTAGEGATFSFMLRKG